MPVLIAGASLAGLTAAQTLRSAGYDRPIVVVDPSSEIPADRPPLSKQVLSGEWTVDKAVLAPATRLDDLDLDLRLGVAAESLVAPERRVLLSDGSTITADGIVLATGSAPRQLPGPRLGGVHVLRNLSDSLALRSELGQLAGSDHPSGRVVIIGAGFIGSEVAAVCRDAGIDVTMIEAGPAPLGRVLPRPVGDFIAGLHSEHGVEVLLGVGVAELESTGSSDGTGTGTEARVSSVRLSDGRVIEASTVVVGIGAVPNTAWLAGSGLSIDNGVVCDETCLAAPGIVAAGDVAAWPNPLYGEVMRVEQWENAIEQGEHAARRLLVELTGTGEVESFRSIPWFWSDQYGLKLQMAGVPEGSDEMVVVHGAMDERRFVALFRRGDMCSAVLGVNRPRHVMQTRMKMRESLAWESAMSIFA